MSYFPSTQHRRGFTLIELLIVITIMTLMAAVAIPRILPAFKDRKIRELSRQLNAYIAGAKARAVERGRPVGVWFQRSANNPNECLQVFIAESAGVYTGDSLGETASFQQQQGIWKVSFGGDTTLTAPQIGLVNDTDVNHWVMARFNHQGGFHKCQKEGGASTFTFYNNTPPPIAQLAANNPGLAISFEVLLPPRRSMATPLDVPSGLAIDLSVSGMGPMGYDFDYMQHNENGTNQNYNVIVMFSAGGDVSDVYTNGVPTATFGTVHFLIGQDNAETNASVTASTPYNIQDPLSLWVSVGTRSGSITTAENFWNPAWGNAPFVSYLSQCRKYATSNQTMGGG